MSGNEPRKLHSILNDIASDSLQTVRGLLLQELTLHPQLASYRLQKLDAWVLCQAWRQSLQGENPALSPERMLELIDKPEWSMAENLSYIGGLLDRCVLHATTPLLTDYRRHPVQLLKTEFRLSSLVTYKIMDLEPNRLLGELLDYRPFSEKQLADMVNQAFELIRGYFWEAEVKLNPELDFSYADYYLGSIDPLINLLRFGLDCKLSRAMRQARLSKPEAAIVIYLLYRRFNDLDSVDADSLCRLVCANSAEVETQKRWLREDSNLCRSGIVEEDRGDFALAEELIEHKSDLEAYLADFREEAEHYACGTGSGDSQALRRLPCSHSLQDLILPQKDGEQLASALQRFKGGQRTNLANWGIKINRYGSNKAGKGLTALFYGAPGTGKTFATGGIAHELGKDLMWIDASKLRNHWYGDTEKLVKGVFDTMAELTREADNPPVFLLNECDQIIHKRDAHPIGTDATENAIQNIILEQLESFPGILIMTTNLLENIDPAYFRRFDIKIEFNLPDFECRKRLWKLHLPPSIPGVDKIPLEGLARDYPFTGGQIDLVVKNACSEAITREGAACRLTLADLIKYAEREQPWIGRNGQKPVGFQAHADKEKGEASAS